MMSSEDYAQLFKAKEASTNATDRINDLLEEENEFVGGAQVASNRLHDYKNLLKKYLVPKGSVYAVAGSDANNPSLSFIAGKVIGERST